MVFNATLETYSETICAEYTSPLVSQTGQGLTISIGVNESFLALSFLFNDQYRIKNQ